jgi:hypothetical protein
MKAYHAYIIVCLALLAAWFYLGYRPLAEEQLVLDSRATQARAELLDFRITVASFPEELRTRQALEATRKELNSSLIAKQDILMLFRELELQADNRNLQITEITPPLEELLELNKVVASPDSPEFISIAIRLIGGYEEFGDYLAYIEHARFFRGISHCDVSVGPPDQPGLSLHIRFKALLGNLSEAS